jgi:hypothetical protein
MSVPDYICIHKGIKDTEICQHLFTWHISLHSGGSELMSLSDKSQILQERACTAPKSRKYHKFI